jgi:type II secretion system protein J
MKKNREGFTLLELLIAVSIFSVIAVALYSSFSAGIRIMRRSEAAMEFHQGLRLALSEVSLDLRNSLPAEIHRGAEEGVPGEEEEPVYYFLGDAKSFRFVTVRDIYERGRLRREICNVRYYLSGGGGGTFMRQTTYQGKGYSDGSAREDELAGGVDDIEMLYSYEPEDEDSPPVWLNYWEEEEKIPLGVRISLKIREAGSIGELVKTVYIETGELGVQSERLPGL